MRSYLTQRDIVELLKITVTQFKYYAKKFNIKPTIDGKRLYFYTIQDLITLYNVIYTPKNKAVFESKINYKTMKL